MLEKYNDTEATLDVTVFFEQCPVCESYDVISESSDSDKCTSCGMTWSLFTTNRE